MTTINENSQKYDFGGVATQYEVVCDDTRIIHAGTFDHQHGDTVPLVYIHRNNDITQVLGHAVLLKSDTPLGMRVKAKFNTSKEGRAGKHLVHSKEFKFLSIWANNITENREEDGLLHVTHGQVREVSIVQAGNKNPGAVIDEVIVHSYGLDGGFLELDGLIIHAPLEIYEDEEEVNHDDESEEPETAEEEEDSTGGEETETNVDETEEPAEEEDSNPEPQGEEEPAEDIAVEHAAEETIQDVINTFTDDQLDLVSFLIGRFTGEDTTPAESSTEEGTGPTVEEVYQSLSEKQLNVLEYMIGQMADPDTISHGDEIMPTNIFEIRDPNDPDRIISHAEFWSGVFSEANRKRTNSLMDVVVSHAGTYGIDNISNLFPDAKSVTGTSGPPLYGPRKEWVDKVLSGIRRVPFSRIKSTYADITADEARALGYVTATQKIDQVFPVLKRVTEPTTIYIRQRLDRDDLLDITEFDALLWVRGILEIKMEEEKARAILYGDQRAPADAYKIDETKIRPILNDAALYNTVATLEDADPLKWMYVEDPNFTEDRVLELIDFVAASMEDYRGSGEPIMFCAYSVYAKMMLLRDTTGRRIHKTKAELAAALLVGDIVTVPDLSGMTITEAGVAERQVIGIIVNMSDYVTGADRGGEPTWFNQFNIDYNQYVTLLEQRCSGALVTPKTAITVLLTAEDLS